MEGLLTGVIDETLLNDLINHLKVFDGSYYGQIIDNNEADIVGKTIQLLEKIERQIK